MLLLQRELSLLIRLNQMLVKERAVSAGPPPARLGCVFPRDKGRLCLLALGHRAPGAGLLPPRAARSLTALEARPSPARPGRVRACGEDKSHPLLLH